MSNYDKTNTGNLGKNQRREKDTHPEYTGQINIEGVEYWLSAWIKENGQTGEKFFSLSVKPKDQQRQSPPPQQRQTQSYARPQAQQQGEMRHGYGKTPPPPHYEELSADVPDTGDVPF